MSFIKTGDEQPIEIIYKSSDESKETREKIDQAKEEAGKQFSENHPKELN